MYVCVCNGITEQKMEAALENNTLPDVGNMCCVQFIEDWLDAHPHLKTIYRNLEKQDELDL